MGQPRRQNDNITFIRVMEGLPDSDMVRRDAAQTPWQSPPS